MKILIKNMGWIGDNIFASSIPTALKKENNDLVVDMLPSIMMPFELLSNHPDIDNIVLSDNGNYDKIYVLKPIHRKETPCVQMQKRCGVKNPTSNFKVYTNKSTDFLAKTALGTSDKINIACQLDWSMKSITYTEEQYYDDNIQFSPSMCRNTNEIIKKLHHPKINLIPVGKPPGYNQKSAEIDEILHYTFTASLIKNCDFFIGSEGGLSNIAAGVDTPTIITTDTINFFYGPNGRMEKCETPQLGPKKYNMGIEHYEIGPYATNQEILNQIKEIINV